MSENLDFEESRNAEQEEEIISQDNSDSDSSWDDDWGVFDDISEREEEEPIYIDMEGGKDKLHRGSEDNRYAAMLDPVPVVKPETTANLEDTTITLEALLQVTKVTHFLFYLFAF